MAGWRDLAKQAPQAWQSAEQGISTGAVNNLLKDTDAAKNLLKVADFNAYNQMEKKDDKMNFLQRVGEALSFDEWSDDVVWAMKQFHDDSGKATPLRGMAASTVGLPIHYLQTAGRKLAGAITGSGDLAEYEGARGKDIIPQAIAMAKMGTPEGKYLMQQKGGALDYTDFDEILNKGNMSQGAQKAAKFATGAVGLAADILTPTMFITAGGGAVAKGTAKGAKTIRSGIKAAGATSLETLAKESPQQAAKIARSALKETGIKASKKNINRVLKEGPSFIENSLKETTKPGLYFSKPFSTSAKLGVEGKKLDTVARYLDNPIAAVFSDAKKTLGKIPLSGGKTFGEFATEINDDIVRKHFQHNFIVKKSSPDLAKRLDKLTSDLAGAKTRTALKEGEVERVLQDIMKLEDLPEGFKPENLAPLKEYLAGNISYTDLNGYLKNAPIPIEQKAAIAKVFKQVEEKAVKGEGKTPGQLTKEALEGTVGYPIKGDLWDQDGVHVVTTNMGGVHGRGLAKQAKDMGLIGKENFNVATSPKGKNVITLAVKGSAPETALKKGAAYSEQVTGKNLELLSSEIDQLIEIAKKNPKRTFYMPYAGMGFGEGKAEEILPILKKLDAQDNIKMVAKDDSVVSKYADAFKPGVRADKVVQEVTKVASPMKASEEKLKPLLEERDRLVQELDAPTYDKVADLIDSGVKPKLSEIAVFEPKRYKLAIKNEFQLQAAKRKAWGIKEAVKKDFIRKRASERVNDILKRNYGDPKYYKKVVEEDATGIPVSIYKPKFSMDQLIKQEWKTAAEEIDMGAVDKQVDETVQSYMGVRIKALESGKYDPLTDGFEVHNTGGFTLDEIKNEIGDIADRLETKFGMDKTVSEMYEKVLREYSSLGGREMPMSDLKIDLEKQLTYLEWRRGMSYKGLLEIAGGGEELETISSLSRKATEPYKVKIASKPAKSAYVSAGGDSVGKEERITEFLNEDVAKTIEVEEKVPKLTWKQYLQKEAVVMREKNARKYEKLVKDKFTKDVYIKSGELETVDKRIKSMAKAEQVYDSAIKDSHKAAPVTSKAEEVIVSDYVEQTGEELTKATKLVDMTQDQLTEFDSMLKQAGFSKAGRKRMVDGVLSYQEVATNARGFVKDFQKWLVSVPMPNDQKKQIGGMLKEVFDYYGKDFDSPSQIKGVLNSVYKLREAINNAGQLDARSKIIADYFNEVLVKPMEEQANSYLMRKQWWPESAGMGVVGYIHKSMDTDGAIPEVSRLMDRKERKIANDAMMAAYNTVLGKGEAFKTKNRVETFVKDVIGHQAGQNSKLYAIHNNMAGLLNEINSGKAGELIQRYEEGAKVNEAQWVKMNNIPLLKDANVWAHKDIAKEFDSLVNFYNKGEMNEVIKHINTYNDFWKVVQTGGGVNLPKIKGGMAAKFHAIGMGKFVDFYNNDLAFIPVSPGFTFRNLTTNIVSTAVVTGANVREIVEYTGVGIDLIRAMKKLTHASDTSLGLAGLFKGSRSEKQLEELLEKSIDAGLWGTTFKGAEWMDPGIVKSSLSKKVLSIAEQNRSLDFNQNIEMMSKLGIFAREIESGKSVQEATAMVDRALFDYSKLTSTERDIIKPLTVFYTWTKRNVELMAQITLGTGDAGMDVNSAKRLRLIAKLLLEPGRQFSTTNEQEQGVLPEWVGNTANMTFKDSEGQANIVTGYGANVEALGDWFNGPKEAGMNMVDMLAPTYKLPLNVLGTGMNTFKGIPIEQDTSAYQYRSLPQPLKDLLGVKEKKWVDRHGKEGVTYTMDGTKKYILESLLGRGVSVPAKLFSIASGDTPALRGLGSMATGIQSSTYDLDYLTYKAQKEEQERVMQELERLGLVSGYSGYGANTKGIQINSPQSYEYLKSVLGEDVLQSNRERNN